jgi:porphobilinogen synthase
VSSFPQYRPRRLRRTAALRNLVRETHLAAAQLVLPVFVREGKKLRRAVGSMPGVNQTSIDEMLKDAAA